MKTNLLLCLAFIFVFAACERPIEDEIIEEDEQLDTSGPIAQKWICEEVTAEGYEPIIKNENTGKVLLEVKAVGVSYDENYELIFTEKPNKIVSEGSFNLKITINFVDKSGTGAIKIDPIIENLIDPSLLFDGDWNRIDDYTISVINEEEIKEVKLIELTKKSLVMKVIINDYPIIYNGKEYMMDIKAKMKFIKE